MGSITRMKPDEAFPADGDLDMMLVVDGPTVSTDPLDELYREIAIEAGMRGRAEYETAAKVLANPEIADHIAASGTIVSDPQGLLGSIQPAVARELSLRRWVVLRCDEEKRRFRSTVQTAAGAELALVSVGYTQLVAVSLCGLISVAQVIPPTHRQCLVRLREQLQALGRPELHEAVLAGFGARDLTRSQVQSFADRAAAAFDRAVEIKRNPSPFDFKLRPYLRPYMIEWTQTMIDRGHYREVVPWIAGGTAISIASLMNDAQASEKPRYVALAGDLVSELGFATSAARAERFRQTADAGTMLLELADEIVSSRPDQLVTT